MKIDAISTHETALIIQQLATHGKWKRERGGASIEIARFLSRAGTRVGYSLTVDRRLVATASAASVAEAVEDMNDMLAAIRRPAQAPAGRVAADPRRTGTPHLVRRARREVQAGGQRGLF